MPYLLDSHALIWFASGENRLSRKVMDIIANDESEITFSMASIWEIAIKSSIGKLDLAMSPQDIYSRFVEAKFGMILIMPEHAIALQSLPWHHRDPFDRMLIAQAKVNGYTLITKDEQIQKYDVDHMW